MNELYHFFLNNGFALELLLAIVLYTRHVARREAVGLRIAASVVLLLGASILWNNLVPPTAYSEILRCLLFYAICMEGLLLCLRIHLNQALFYLTAVGITQHLAYRAAGVTFQLISLTDRLPQVISMYYYPVLAVPYMAAFYGLFAGRMRQARAEDVKNGSAVMLMAGMMLCVNIFCNLFNEYVPSGSWQLNLTLGLSDMATCIFLLFLQLELVRSQTVEQDNAVLRQFMSQQKKQMETSRETIDLINIKCHDIKNQIATLGSRIPQDQVDDLNRLVGIYDTDMHTGCEPLDILLAEKLLLCRSRDVCVDCMVDGTCLSMMKPADIYSLFGNALDNAMEAVMPIVEQERRHVSLRVHREKGMAVIHVENEFNGMRIFEDGLPRTTKHDRGYHGFGMKSIRMITEKYGGYLSAKTEGSTFVLNILLPSMS